MKTESFILTRVFPVAPAVIYSDWLSAAGHTAMTGGRATGDASIIGERFVAWNGYSTFVTTALETNSKIVQQWRSVDFPAGHPDSVLTVLLTEHPEGALLTLTHSNLPEGQGINYEKGWEKHYFQPMLRYYAEGRNT